jgi:hypothetical protein
VHAHPHPHRRILGPGVRRQSLLCLCRRRQCRPGRREAGKERVALRAENTPAGRLDGAGDQLPVLLEQARVVVSMPLQQLRGALDVGEQESRDRDVRLPQLNPPASG